MPMPIIIPKQNIVSLKQFRPNMSKVRRFYEMLYDQIVKTVDLHGPFASPTTLPNTVPMEYKTGKYGIRNIRVQSSGDFKAILIIGGHVIETIDSHYLLDSDKHPSEPNTYIFSLTQHIILINLLMVYHSVQINIVSDDPNIVIRYDIVHHSSRNIPQSLIHYKQYYEGTIDNQIVPLLLVGFCNQIHIWIKHAKHVILKLYKNDGQGRQWSIVDLKKSNSKSDLWSYVFNKTQKFNNTIDFCRSEIYLQTDAPIGTQFRIRYDTYNVYRYSYTGRGRGKIATRLTGLHYAN